MAKIAWVFILTMAASVTLTPVFTKNATIINVKPSEAQLHHTLKGNPIVVHTQAQNYEHPTMSEYEECHRNLDNCKKSCKYVPNRTDCESKCPVCPILITEDIIVQGINDTDYRLPPTNPLNTTNIIRLTNEIHNIIDHQTGNVTHNSVNNVYIQQNVSRVGGKYGFGFNHTQPCCMVVRSPKTCHKSKFSTAARCHHKRNRVCGEKCKARVMFAKRVKVCERSLDDDDDDLSEEYETCHKATRYVPYHKRTQSNRLKCFYQSRWPYVSCPNRGRTSIKSMSCERCNRIPYGRILRYGVPTQCLRCFQRYPFGSGYGFNMYPSYYSPAMGPWPVIMNDNIDTINDEDDFDGVEIEVDNWTEDKTKCRLADGSLSDDCVDLEGSGDDFETDNGLHSGNKPTTDDPLEKLPEAQFNDEDYYDDTFLQTWPAAARRRRHSFNRSKYSRRNTEGSSKL